MNALLIIVTGVVGTTGIAWALHLKRLKNHVGVSREDFIRHFYSAGNSSDSAGAVYDQFRKLGTWQGFMPSPTDSLEGTYKTVDEDVEENLNEILRGLHLDMPHSGIRQEWDKPVEALSDVVRWVDWVRTKQD